MAKKIAEYRRPEIVQATIKAILAQGLSTPSYDDIAREAGMSRQLIRHYFQDPEALMVAVCDALAASYRACLAQGIIAADSTSRLAMFFDFYFNFLAPKGLRKPVDDAAYDAMFALAAGSAAVRQNLREQYDLLHHVIAHEVQIAHPGLHQKACDEIGFLFVSLMYGHWKMVATLGFSERYNRVSRAAMDRLVASYLAGYDDPDDLEPPEGE
jgi:AcrR family transcriptional regulator